jgi:DNA-directed RNA polymerase subunit RPC12/RpoP
MMHYTCALCGGEFEKTSDDAANAEAERIWGVKDASESPDMEIVCDDCWQLVKPQWAAT